MIFTRAGSYRADGPVRLVRTHRARANWRLRNGWWRVVLLRSGSSVYTQSTLIPLTNHDGRRAVISGV